jgi:hypothetical protein
MKQIICKDTNEICDTYKEYMNSKHWHKAKLRFKNSKLYNNKCHICNTHENNTVILIHHKTYKTIGNENLNHLSALCEKCHVELHKLWQKAIAEKKNLSKTNRWFLVKKMRKQFQKNEMKKITKLNNKNCKQKNVIMLKPIVNKRKIEGLRKENIILRKINN